MAEPKDPEQARDDTDSGEPGIPTDDFTTADLGDDDWTPPA